MNASQRLDALLSGRMPMSKLAEFVEEVEAGTKELEAKVDELRPRFQDAMQKGRQNMARMQNHIERVTKSVETIEAFNRRMSNMEPSDDLGK